MKSLFTLIACCLTLAAPLWAQSTADALAAAELIFSHPEITKVVEQENWKEDVFYIRHNSTDGHQTRTVFWVDLLDQAEPDQLKRLPLPIVLIHEDQLPYVADGQPSSQQAVLEIGGMYRGGNVLSVNLSLPLVSDLRKSLHGSFVLNKRGENWVITQSYVQVR